MIKRRHKELICILLVLLVLTLPFLSANATAEIMITKASGSLGVPDYRALRDSTVVEFTTDTDNVRAVEQPYTSVACMQQTDLSYSCVFRSYEQSISTEESRFTIQKYDLESGFIPGTDKVAVAYVDNLPPMINSWSAALSDDKSNLILSWDITDKSYGESPRCSGIKNIQFIDDETGLVFASFEINRFHPECQSMNSVPVENLVPAGSSEEKRICIIVNDNLYNGNGAGALEHQTKDCREILIDRKDPVLECPYKAFSGKDEIKYISTRGYNSFIEGARIEIKIREDQLSRINANLAELSENPFFQEGYQNLEWPANPSINCSNTTDLWTCHFNGIHFEPWMSDPTIRLQIWDGQGQSSQSACSAHFEIDNDAPEVMFFGSNKIRNERSFVNNATQLIFARYRETAAGFYKRHVYWDLSSLNPEYNGMVVPSDCIKENDEEWVCQVNASVTATTEGSALALGMPEVFDDANNQVTSSGNYVTLDVTPPAIVDSKTSTTCVVSGETLKLEFNVSDQTSGVKSLSVNARTISSYPENITGSCEEKEGNYWKCTAEIDYILTEAKTDAPVDIYIEDVAGNINHQVIKQSVCEPVGDVTPNFVTVKIKKTIPERIDRRLASYQGIPLAVMIPLEFNSHGARIMRVQDDDCAAIKDYIDFEQAPYLFDEYGKNTTLVVKLMLDEDAISKDYFNLSCNLSFRMQVGSRVYMLPEFEEIKINVPFYNWPLGYADSAAQEKIKDAKGEIRKLDGKIKSLENVNKYLGFILGLAHTLGAINSGLQIVKSVLYAISLALAPVFGIGEALWRAVCHPFDFFHGFITKWIWPVGIIPVGGFLPGYIFKWATIIYECGLCKFDTWMDIGLTLGASDLAEAGSEAVHTPITDYSGTMSMEWAMKQESGRTFGMTTLVNDVNADGWILEPYKSIHYARGCLCLPGILYNLKKLRQINCRYVSCLNDHAKKGLPIDACDVMKKEMECLYWDSAQYKLHGFIGEFFAQLIKQIWANLPGILISIAIVAFCSPYYFYGTDAQFCTGGLATGWLSVTCGLSMGALSFMELNDYKASGWNEQWKGFDDRLSEHDLCQGVDYSE